MNSKVAQISRVPRKLSLVVTRVIDRIDAWATFVGILSPADWSAVLSGRERNLYAGRLSRHEPQYLTHLGVTPYDPSTRNIDHDLRRPFPIPDNMVDTFQASDVFEHLDYGELPAIVAEIYRVLRPGGLFRMSVPDYRSEVYRQRCLLNAEGDVLFDPGGGGRFEAGRVVDGGHLWFPIFETVAALFDGSPFHAAGEIRYLHYFGRDTQPVTHAIDYSRGYIARTPDHDPRTNGSGAPLSIVVDAVKAFER